MFRYPSGKQETLTRENPAPRREQKTKKEKIAGAERPPRRSGVETESLTVCLNSVVSLVSRSAIADVDPNWISTKPTQSQDTEVCGDLDLDLDLSLSLDLASAALALGVGTADVSVHPTAPP